MALDLTTKNDPMPETSHQPCRVELRSMDDPSSRSTSYIDGGWWPRSLDLVEELPPLLAHVRRAGFHTVRVTYRLHAWAESPRRIVVDGQRITLGGYRKQIEDTIGLVDTSGQKRLELLVIPPDTDPAVAQRALAIAGRDGDRDRAREVLDSASAG